MVSFFLGMPEKKVGDAFVSAIICPGCQGEIDLGSVGFLCHLRIQGMAERIGESVGSHNQLFISA
jgi:hypothetical protein